MNRGQSEVLGYVIVFSIIIGSVALVYATGYPSLESAREATATENVEKAFDVMDENIRDIQQRGAPSRATEIRIAGGTLELEDPATIRVYVENSTNSSDNATTSFNTVPVRYVDESGRVVSFESGGIIRGNGTDSAMIEGPDWTITEEASIFPVQTLIARGGTRSVGGETTVLVLTQLSSTSAPGSYQADSSSRSIVNITVYSDNTRAWQQYFEQMNGTVDDGVAVDGDIDDGNVYWKFRTDEAHVIRKGISVEFVR